MSYKIQCVYLGYPSGNNLLVDLEPPGPGWHVENIFPITTSSNESEIVNLNSVWSSAESKNKDIESRSRMKTNTIYALVLWKQYTPSLGAQNDDVGNHEEAKAWA